MGMSQHPYEAEVASAFCGFGFNKARRVYDVLQAGLETAVFEGKLFLKIVRPDLEALKSSTHFQVTSSVGGIDFCQEKFARNDEVSEMLEVTDRHAEIELVTEFPEGYPVYYHMISVRQYMYVNGDYISLSSKQGCAADIVQVLPAALLMKQAA